MQVDLIFKMAAVGLTVSFLNLLLNKAGREEHALLLTLTGLVVIMSVLVQQLGALFSAMRTAFGL